MSATRDSDWPPSDGASYIRSEAFCGLVFELAATLARRYWKMDFSNSVARVFV